MSPVGGTMSLFMLADNKESGARFSHCRLYRYQLWRIWDTSRPYLNVVGLNPSTADETKDDPTIRCCKDFARRWGYGGLYMTNIFAFRATLPKDMKQASDPIGAENNYWLQQTAARAGLVVAAWGVHGGFKGRDQAVMELIPDLHCFRKTQSGRMPAHPLYLPRHLTPIPFHKEVKVGCD